jgi:hypothetical protein
LSVLDRALIPYAIHHIAKRSFDKFLQGVSPGAAVGGAIGSFFGPVGGVVGGVIGGVVGGIACLLFCKGVYL